MPFKKCIGPARVVTMKVGQSISAQDLASLDWKGVERILFKTMLTEPVQSAFDSQFIFLTEDAARFLGERGLLLAGTDAPSVDAFNSRTLTAHRTLLHCGVAILEGVRLARVPDGDYELICLPLKLAGADGSPVRAILRR
jgi:arylformamidase